MFTFISEDGLNVHVHEWLPEAAPRGVVQIAHGRAEHGGRYAPLARALNDIGFAVYANDHRGHGQTIHGWPGDLGEKGWPRLVADMATLTRLLRGKHPGLPVILIGHSMGSFATQHYLLDHQALVDAAVLSGTTAVDKLYAYLATLGGDRAAAYNGPFEPARTPADWLSRDSHQVDLYLADPLCGFAINEASMSGLGDVAASRLAAPAGLRPDLPLYVVVGDADPLNQSLAFSDVLVERYRRAGLRDITYKTYPGARHEVFNETNRDQVFRDLMDWLDRVP